MGRREPLPDEFDGAFSVRIAKATGVGRGRLRGPDLETPFHGVRVAPNTGDGGPVTSDPYERQRQARIARARLYAPRMHFGHFFSHQTAVSIWGGPLPLEFADNNSIRPDAELALHVTARGAVPFPRAKGVTGHRTLLSLTSMTEHDGLRVTSPAATWVSLGTLPLVDLIALGDYLCRRWRRGHGRPHVDRAPLATVDELRTMLTAGRRRGADRLREAIDSVREDAWSPRETKVRCILVAEGLPEPELNVDIFNEFGRFLGCVDMAYPEQRVAVEYLGMLHGETWANDVERIAALRAAGWIVIEVTSPLLRRPTELANRVRSALRR